MKYEYIIFTIGILATKQTITKRAIVQCDQPITTETQLNIILKDLHTKLSLVLGNTLLGLEITGYNLLREIPEETIQ